MKVNRGCGCVLLALAAVDLLFIIGAIFGVVTGETSLGLGMLALGVFGANMVAVFLLGFAGVRGIEVGTRSPVEEPVEVAGEAEADDEGEDAEPE